VVPKTLRQLDLHRQLSHARLYQLANRDQLGQRLLRCLSQRLQCGLLSQVIFLAKSLHCQLNQIGFSTRRQQARVIGSFGVQRNLLCECKCSQQLQNLVLKHFHELSQVFSGVAQTKRALFVEICLSSRWTWL
jgi:hypothetical protein